MKNVFSFFLTFSIFQRHYAFHKESYYGDPYSMEYVGKFSTVNLTKEDILFADYIVDMLRNTNYSTIDFDAPMTLPSRFRHLYETGVETESTRRYATISTKSPTKEKMWDLPQNDNLPDTNDLYPMPNSISPIFPVADTKSSRLMKKSTCSILLDKHESKCHERIQTKNVVSLYTKMSENGWKNSAEIMTRSIDNRKNENLATERFTTYQTTEKSINNTFDFTTTRKRRSIPYPLNSDSGPWLTSKEQEQMWALRGTSLLDSEKYDYPFPYDFDKWPGCTTKDLSDPKNTIQIYEYENGHVRVEGISKPGWNEFPWKPTEFTTRYPAYLRLNKYLTFLTRPWYGYYSTLSPTMSINWNKKTTRAWSRYTFANISRKSKYDIEKLKTSQKWIVDLGSPDWNRTIFPPSSVNTWKRTWWGGDWYLTTGRLSKLKANSSYFRKANASSSKPTLHPTTSHAYISTQLSSDASMQHENKESTILRPRKPISSKSTPGFGFLSISPTWYTYVKELSTAFPYSNASWISEWSRVWHAAVSNAASKSQWARTWKNEISIPLYTYAKTTWSPQWFPKEWFNQRENTTTSVWRRTFHMQSNQSQSPLRRGGNFNQRNVENPQDWRTTFKQNIGGWSLPALTKAWANQWSGGQLAGQGKNLYTQHPYYQQPYSNQWESGRWPSSGSGTFSTKSRSPWSQQYGGVPTWTDGWKTQWNRRQWSQTPYTKPYQYQQYSKQWKGGQLTQWNRENSHLWNKNWPTKPYQEYSNQWKHDVALSRSRTWYTTKLQQSYLNQRRQNVNQWNAGNTWAKQYTGGWSQAQAWTRTNGPSLTWNRNLYTNS
ncbi:uncharacterized protein LOC135836671 [Planococcus citri]|uniref:uncharacterized protein LOC135836671 n=1 Tax=Planococcus citri TaxID=170843 RepID=UPI0031F960F2